MDSHALAYQRFYAATEAIRAHPAKPIERVEPQTPVCGTCNRSWEHVEEPGQSVLYQYDASMAPQWQCLTCATARIGSYDAFGIERKAGKSGATVAAKLSMMMGTAIVITPNNVLHYAPPKAMADRFKQGLYAQQGQMHSRPGQFPLLLLLAQLWDNDQLGDPAAGFVCIGGFNRKADVVMSALRASTDLREVWVHDNTGVQVVDFRGLVELRDRLRALDLIDKACRPAFWKPILDATKGQRNEKALAKWLETTPAARELLALLPEDPHARLNLHQQLKQMEGR